MPREKGLEPFFAKPLTKVISFSALGSFVQLSEVAVWGFNR